MRLVRCLLIMPAVLFAVGCARHHESAPEPYDPPTLQVENHNYLDVDIEVIHEGQRGRLGTVLGSSSKEFVFPRSLLGRLGQIRLVAHAVGSPETITTDLIVVKSGTRVRWTLQSSLYRSSLAVYE